MSKKIALVTGATSGIGEATARKLAQEGYHVIVTGRRKERLENLSADLTSNFNTEALPLTFDIRERSQVKQVFQDLPEKWKNIDVLINNAGLASGLHHFDEGNVDDWERMIDTNVKGLLYISRAIAPQMVTRGAGHIINIGSTAGKEVYEKGNVYCATKHAVDALTKGMRIDMLKHNIKVTSIDPGMVETEFSEVRFHGNKEKAEKVYQGFTPLHAEDIAETIAFVLSRPEHVCLNDIVMTATRQANSFYKILDNELE
ncbi:MAG: SDR family oxidoreductase [Bacteroidales bacterium]